MASRGASAAYLTELAKQGIQPCHLVKISFSSILYLTDFYKKIPWSSNDYQSDGRITGIPEIVGSIDMSMQLIDLEMSGADLATLSVALSENYINKEVLIHRALVDINGVLIVDPVQVYDGTIDSFTHVEDPNGESILTWTCSNHWATFKQRNGRRTNTYDQQFHYSGDTFFKFSSEIIRSFEWRHQNPPTQHGDGASN